MESIGILGAGTWGVALAKLLAEQGHDVTVWSPTGGNLAMLRTEHRHPHLPDAVIPEEILFTTDAEEACRGKGLVVVAVGSVYVRETARKVREYLSREQIVVNVAKGLEKDSFYTMTEVIREELEGREELKGIRIAALSGPTHAEEVARGLPATIVAASEDPETARRVQEVFSSTLMRVYTNTDVRGVEFCGALKNIMALAAGISVGLGYGDNIRAALITRGMAEIARLGTALGCEERTFYGLAGMGDLIVTCTSMNSRNNRCGVLLGQGVKAEEAVRQVGMVVEGINALPAALSLAEKYGVDVPLISAVDAVVNRGADPRETLPLLMNRARRSEFKQNT